MFKDIKFSIVDIVLAITVLFVAHLLYITVVFASHIIYIQVQASTGDPFEKVLAPTSTISFQTGQINTTPHSAHNYCWVNREFKTSLIPLVYKTYPTSKDELVEVQYQHSNFISHPLVIKF